MPVVALVEVTPEIAISGTHFCPSHSEETVVRESGSNKMARLGPVPSPPDQQSLALVEAGLKSDICSRIPGSTMCVGLLVCTWHTTQYIGRAHAGKIDGNESLNELLSSKKGWL